MATTYMLITQELSDGSLSNVHVLETRYSSFRGERVDTTSHFRCGEKKKGREKVLFETGDKREVRTELARRQNEGIEICGRCVSTFYADDKR